MGNRPSQEEVRKMVKDGSLFLNYQKMVFKIAHNLKKSHPIEDFDDLVAEGYLGILKHAPDYDPEKSSLCTWIYKSAWGRMKTLCIDPKTHREIPTDFTDPIYDQPVKSSVLSFLKELSEDALFLISTTNESPGELFSVIRESAPATSRKALKKYMEYTIGWEIDRISNAWNEIAECF